MALVRRQAMLALGDPGYLAVWLKVAGGFSSRSHAAKREHWFRLQVADIDAAADPRDVKLFLEFIQDPFNNDCPWGKPCRGYRGGTHWEALNMAARNRLARELKV